MNQFEGPPYDNWLYNTVAQEWSRWLDVDAQKMISDAGYYTALIAPGHRVISINSNYGQSGNFWLILEDSGDVGGQLQWLNETLAAARAKHELVYIISHIPWSALMSNYSNVAWKLMDEYQDVVVAQFFGHTHEDEFVVTRDFDTNTKPINTAFVAPSVTPTGNPAFRAYLYNRTTKQVLDWTAYYTDVNEDNAQGSATWRPLYQARTEYNLASCTPADMQDLIARMYADSKLLDKYDRNYFSGRQTLCNAQCQKSRLCFTASTTPDLYNACMNTFPSPSGARTPARVPVAFA